ncbi:MAG: hypothetical protein LM580_12630, partial [Thermofilum sp.]|nr:hypothetical protein [Thermofilum sp.]
MSRREVASAPAWNPACPSGAAGASAARAGSGGFGGSRGAPWLSAEVGRARRASRAGAPALGGLA